jgi:hypothetical protein
MQAFKNRDEKTQVMIGADHQALIICTQATRMLRSFFDRPSVTAHYS